MKTSSRKYAAAAATLVILITSACSDKLGLLPKWDADWDFPLPSQKINLQAAFGGNPTIPVSPATATISFNAQPMTFDGLVGTILGDSLSNASIAMTVTSAIPLSGSANIYVVAAVGDTSNPSKRIKLPITLVAATPQKDSVRITVDANGLALLKTASQNQSTLQVLLSGSVTYNGPAPRTFQSTDSIGVKLAMLATVGISK